MVKDSGLQTGGKKTSRFSLSLAGSNSRSLHFGDSRPSTTVGKKFKSKSCIGYGGEDDTDRKSFALAYFNPLTSTPILSPVALAIFFVIFA